MKGKKISMRNPKIKLDPENSVENWVANREEIKRLTIDVSSSLHTQLKMDSVKNGKAMGEIVRECIEQYLRNK